MAPTKKKKNPFSSPAFYSNLSTRGFLDFAIMKQAD